MINATVLFMESAQPDNDNLNFQIQQQLQDQSLRKVILSGPTNTIHLEWFCISVQQITTQQTYTDLINGTHDFLANDNLVLFNQETFACYLNNHLTSSSNQNSSDRNIINSQLNNRVHYIWRMYEWYSTTVYCTRQTC